MRTSILNQLTVFVWRMIQLSFFLAIANAVLIVTLLFIPLVLVTLPAYAISLLLLIPSLVALMLTIKRMDESTTSLLRLYIKCYREEFKGSLKYAVAYVLGVLILFMIFAYAQEEIERFSLIPLYFIMAILIYVHLMFGILMRVSFIVDIKGTWRLGLYCIARYPIHALFVFAGTLILGVIIPIVPFLLPMGIIPAAFYLFFATTKNMVSKISEIVIINENEEDK